MVMTAILLPVLLMFVALAVDVAYYYYRGVQIQRAADSAALAGVTRMPKFSEARRIADDVAKRNGFVNAGDTEVAASRIPKNNKRLVVTIRDKNVPTFFGRLIRSNWEIERKATAEYVSSIPLGSRENAIGTGYLTDSGQLQNFWLAVAGPCSPKEAGDQFSTRLDGNAVNVALATGNTEKYSQLCDVDPAAVPAPKSSTAFLRAERDAKNSANPGDPLFPALVVNRDYTQSGYNYIVDVPCAPQPSGEILPPPCDGQLLPGDLVIQAYDPVFNPDSIQRFAQQVVDNSSAPLRSELWTNEKDDRLRPDKYGVVRPGDIKGCTSTQIAKCRTADIGTNNPAPWDVRVTTDVRVYPPDDTPLDYSDDDSIALTGSNVVTAVDDPKDPNPPITNGTRRFGTCIKWTDEWTGIKPDVVDPTLFTFASIKPIGGIAPLDNTPGAAPAGFIRDVTAYNTDPGTASAADCTAYSDKWVTIARPKAFVAKRGRYRLNLRTIDAIKSFGQNGFGVRAFFVPTAAPAPEAYPACYLAPAGCAVPADQPAAVSVSGDSTMSVFASVNEPTQFYLAQLSPAAIYRDKTVIVSLWDPGEGADKLQILRPRGVAQAATPTPPTAASPAEGDLASGGTCDPEGTTYCLQKFEWSVGKPGIALFSSTDDSGLGTNGADYADVCEDYGAPLAAAVLPNYVQVGGTENSVENCPAGNTQPTKIVKSRNYQTYPTNRKFNDRLVNVSVKVPSDYGCRVGTGTSDINPCVDLEDLGLPLPEGGWWKIKYIPQGTAGNYKKITDRTTWSVSLRGDPVHLVPNLAG